MVNIKESRASVGKPRGRSTSVSYRIAGRESCAGGSSHACLGTRCKRFGRLSRAEFPDFAGKPWRMMIIASASGNANFVRSCTCLSPIPILVPICMYRCLICPETSMSATSVLAHAILQLLASCVPATHSSNQVTATGAAAVRLSGACKTSSSPARGHVSLCKSRSLRAPDKEPGRPRNAARLIQPYRRSIGAVDGAIINPAFAMLSLVPWLVSRLVKAFFSCLPERRTV